MATSTPIRITLASGQVITPDTCETISHGSQAEATTHPVEDGSAIADHIIRKPNTVSLVTLWTPRPIDDTYLPQGPTRGQDAFDILSGVVQRRETCTIAGDGLVYSPVVLLSVGMQRQFADGDGRTINIEAQEIQIVSGKSVAGGSNSARTTKRLKPKVKTQVTQTRGSLALQAVVGVATGSYFGALGAAYQALQ